MHIDLEQSALLEEHEKYTRMKSFFEITGALRGGTRTMRAAGEVLLPKYKKETPEEFQIRIGRSFLFPAYSDTLDRHAGRPFARPIKVTELNDLRLSGIEKDASLEGETLTAFSRGLFEENESSGITHILVNMPPGEASDNSVDTAIRENRRPIFQHVTAEALYNWKEDIINGQRVLTEIRIRISSDAIVVFDLNEFVTIEKNDKDEWVTNPEKSGVTGLGFVPLVTGYFNRERFMEGSPALWNLAEQNLKHWQQQSDQDKILAFARTGVYFAKGFTPDQIKQIVVGPNKVIAGSPNSDFKVVEYTGSSVAIGEEALSKLQKQMEITGLKPEVQSTVDSSATGIVVNESAVNSDLKVWAVVTEELLTRAYDMAAKRISVELPEDFNVEIYKDFEIAGRRDDMTHLIAMSERGNLSTETLLKETQRRGVLSASVDVDEEIERINAEGVNSASAFNNFGS